eukprot:scaffold136578_cov19-Tisochrysis_lutea.AAC.1
MPVPKRTHSTTSNSLAETCKKGKKVAKERVSTKGLQTIAKRSSKVPVHSMLRLGQFWQNKRTLAQHPYYSNVLISGREMLKRSCRASIC